LNYIANQQGRGDEKRGPSKTGLGSTTWFSTAGSVKKRRNHGHMAPLLFLDRVLPWGGRVGKSIPNGKDEAL